MGGGWMGGCVGVRELKSKLFNVLSKMRYKCIMTV